MIDGRANGHGWAVWGEDVADDARHVRLGLRRALCRRRAGTRRLRMRPAGQRRRPARPLAVVRLRGYGGCPVAGCSRTRLDLGEASRKLEQALERGVRVSAAVGQRGVHDSLLKAHPEERRLIQSRG